MVVVDGCGQVVVVVGLEKVVVVVGLEKVVVDGCGRIIFAVD